MKKEKEIYDHLINNLERITFKGSIFNYESGRSAFLLLGQGNIHDWLDALLPNTRLILEPKIDGYSIAVQYMNGKLNKAINENSVDITKDIRKIKSIPKNIPIEQRLEIRGILYRTRPKSDINNKDLININNELGGITDLIFIAFQIYHCKINHFPALLELKKLNFHIPETQFTKNLSDIEIYRQCWKEGKLFKMYPSSGIILKINSKKLQNILGENNLSLNWAYVIN